MTPSCTKKPLKTRCTCPCLLVPTKQRGLPCEATEGAETQAVGHAVPQGGGQGVQCNALRMGTQVHCTGLLVSNAGSPQAAEGFKTSGSYSSKTSAT